MKILIIGSGAYVLEDAFGPGVILRSVLSWCARKDITPDITLTYNNPAALPQKKQRVADLLAKWGIDQGGVDFLPSGDGLQNLSKGVYGAVFIAVPDAYHAPYMIEALRVDCPLWVVKPVTGNTADLERLSQAGAEKGRIWVDYHKRLDPSNMALKTAVTEAPYGRLLSYQVDYQQPIRLPLEDFSWADSVDPFTYIGCHYVDQIFYLFPDARLKRVDATALKGDVCRAIGQPDMVSAHLTFDCDGQDLAASFQIGWCLPNAAPLKSQQRVMAQFERGTMTLEQARRGIETWSATGVTIQNPYFLREYQDFEGRWMVNGYGYQSVARFLDLAKSGAVWPDKPSYPLYGEACKTEPVLEAVRAAFGQLG